MRVESVVYCLSLALLIAGCCGTTRECVGDEHFIFKIQDQYGASFFPNESIEMEKVSLMEGGRKLEVEFFDDVFSAKIDLQDKTSELTIKSIALTVPGYKLAVEISWVLVESDCCTYYQIESVLVDGLQIDRIDGVYIVVI